MLPRAGFQRRPECAWWLPKSAITSRVVSSLKSGKSRPRNGGRGDDSDPSPDVGHYRRLRRTPLLGRARAPLVVRLSTVIGKRCATRREEDLPRHFAGRAILRPMKVAAYQAPLLAAGSLEAIDLIQER